MIDLEAKGSNFGRTLAQTHISKEELSHKLTHIQKICYALEHALKEYGTKKKSNKNRWLEPSH
jgi:hypothetical protein